MVENMKYSFALLIFLFSISAYSFELPSKIGEQTISLELSGFEVREDSLVSKGTSTVISGNFYYQIDNSFKFKLSPVASFMSGQQTSRDPQAPLSNSIYLKEAAAIFTPLENSKFMLGALRQKEFLPGLVGYHRSFPAAGIILNYTLNDTFNLSLKTQAAVPTSSGLANTQSDFSSTSSLYSGTLALNFNLSPFFQSQLQIAHFKLNNLSSQAASDSLARGNTVIRPSTSSYYFAYKYEGDEVTFVNKSDFNDRTDFNLVLSFVNNSKVPTNIGRGYLISGSPRYHLNSGDWIKFTYELYRIETDALVAVFADPTRGRPNRNGERIGIAWQRKNYEIELMYNYSKVIKQSPFQNNDRAFFLNLLVDRLLVF
jgi:hypothetical protein